MIADGSPESACPGCGAVLPVVDGPTHAYIGASPACWARFAELVGREYGEFDYPDVHRLTVDTYAVQHPGVEERRSIKSVCVHLIALHLELERELDAAAVTRLLNGISQGLDLRWLDPPHPNGTITVVEALAASGLDEHTRLVREWAANVWDAWSPHHETVRAWAAKATPA